MQKVNDELQKPKGNWKSTLFGIGWVVAIIIAIYFLIRPEPVIPLPPGWTIWSETGASRTILPKDDIVYIGGVKGLYVIDSSDNAARVMIDGAPGAEIVNAVLEDRNGALWVCMDEGLAIRKDDIWNYLTDKDGLPKGRVASIA